MKLLTKFPKNGILLHDDGQIYTNHEKIDINLKATYVYCISSLKTNTSGECTKIYSNEIDPLTPDVGAGLADESSYGESVEALVGLDTNHLMASPIWFPCIDLFIMKSIMFFLIKSLNALNPFNMKKTTIISLNCHGSNLRTQYLQR
jgi:hypothetical protein